jgi:pimeloyl-ACP methyl ester carboxylesterase
MVSQTRQVLDSYRDNGGEVREVLFEGCGHSPHLERPAEFRDALLARTTRVSGRLPHRTPGVG